MPKNLKDAIALADWLELSAIEAGDKNSSAGDLLSVLALVRNDDVDDELSLEVIREIERREKATGEGYPFIVQHARVLQAKPNWKDHVAYVFCLCLSYFKWKSEKGAAINPWNLFEELSCIAAAQYFQGRVFHFGSRSKDLKSFSRGVSELCRLIGEGQDFKQQPTLKRKDDKVDLVAWKEFLDSAPGKLIIFGQCAAGDDWDEKIDQLRPDVFWKQWMLEPETSPLIRSFYIPHRLPPEKWQFYARRTGILFDRCRIAYWAWHANNIVLKDERYLKWCKTVLPVLSQ